MGGLGSGAKPREYPPHIVALARALYLNGMTVAEICRVFPRGYRVQTILERHVPERRAAVKRNQRGPNNLMWRGDRAGYKALHLRVATARGKPSECEWCGATQGWFDWANLTGRYEDVRDYARLCRSCHRRHDAARRKGVVPNV